jgi:hypothetical protein
VLEGALVGIPPDDGAFGEEWDDAVHALFGQLLEDRFGSMSLEDREADGDLFGGLHHLEDLAGNLEVVAEPALPPASVSVADGQRITMPKAQ